ncbi:hypothetical protein [Bosea sp. Root381]|uniref:hypothetical protein n=1 Tax=Bosea sp. Root381 TaxID=1736524 RepID=UPI0012E36588|nr:hypothetical protein [Bosea sp. Root381]
MRSIVSARRKRRGQRDVKVEAVLGELCADGCFVIHLSIGPDAAPEGHGTLCRMRLTMRYPFRPLKATLLAGTALQLLLLIG